MLTLKDDPENVQICELRQKKRRTPIFWHPRMRKDLRSAVENLDSFNSEKFRDRFELSKDQSRNIFDGLKHDEVCEHHQSKYFKCKEFIQNSLLTEMNIEDQEGEFCIDFPPGKEFCGHHLIVGGTSSGKTFTAMQKCLRNLQGPKKDRRQFIYFSAEWNRDRTLEPLRDKKLREWVDGVDCSEEGLKDSQWDTAEEFFKNEILLRCEIADSCVIVFDDSMDMACNRFIKPLINRMMRVGRHQGINLIVLLHCLRSASWSSQSHQSCKYITVFPRSQKGKIRDYLNTDLGLSLRESRDIVNDFAQTGRAMTISLHCPQYAMNSNLLRLL